MKLFFTKGALLSKADPNKLLQGRASVRHVVIGSVADMKRDDIEALIAAALKLARVKLDSKAKGAVIIKAEGQKQRARRSTGARAHGPQRPSSAVKSRMSRMSRGR